jgi:myo-inositol-1(or 4)-monophosphatase
MDNAEIQDLLQMAISAAWAAGEVIMRHYRSSYQAWDKCPNNPVTTADLEADYMLHTRLLDANPQHGWLSEETSDSRERLDKRYTWIVDPLDGTQEFINGVDQFAVSVAFVEDNQPVLGVVLNPATGEMFAGIVGQGLSYNGIPPDSFSQRTDPDGTRLLVSDAEIDAGMWEPYREHFDLQPVGSAAYKLARLAAGFGDAYVSLKPKREWDICAGTALVQAAGGRVTDLEGRPVLFNQPNVRINGVVAANTALHTGLLRILGDRNG